jgi:hypothetical protein
VALLGDDQFGDAEDALHFLPPLFIFLGRFRIVVGAMLGLARGDVIVLAEDEPDHVGVLLDRARFAQVRQLRALVLALFDRTAELRQRDHRHLPVPWPAS